MLLLATNFGIYANITTFSIKWNKTTANKNKIIPVYL